MITRGSEWHRWEPHIHAPGTLLNDQFKGPSAWEDYLSTLERATPTIEAIAITDYYVTDTYERVLEHKQRGRLRAVNLVFPNVELRLDVAARRGFVNIHLLVSPEDSDHVERLQSFLSRLHFDAHDERFACTRKDLIRLANHANPSITSDHGALEYGASQFKVNFKQLRDEFNASEWARANVRIAVAGGADDGTSGIRGAADETVRKEIESFSDIILAASPAQREFWLGDRDLTPEQIGARYGGLKPCLHGSDAHKLGDVAAPSCDRFSWIKGGLDFDSLRQACIEPRGRAYVGAEPPRSATPSQVISSLEAIDAPWLRTPFVPLNAGLVTIIGARGSGKTALADMIAAGCDSVPDESWTANEWANPSFLVRARPLLGDGKVKVSWAAGDPSVRSLDGSDANGALTYPRIRYLSQQFVEHLCTANGMTDELLREMERVIFEAHPEDERDNTVDFAELRELRSERHHLARQREADAVADISERISVELEKRNLVPSLKGQTRQKQGLLSGYTEDRAKLVSPGSEDRAKRHTEIAGAANAARQRLRTFTNQRQTLFALQDEVHGFRRNKAPQLLRQTQSRHSNSGMSDNHWGSFILNYRGNVDELLTGNIKGTDAEIAELKGNAPPTGDPAVPLFADDADLSRLPLSLLEAEMARLERLVSADREIQRQYAAVSNVIAKETAALERLTAKLRDYLRAEDRARTLYHEREQAYGRAFDALVSEQSVLEELYGPLMARLGGRGGDVAQTVVLGRPCR